MAKHYGIPDVTGRQSAASSCRSESHRHLGPREQLLATSQGNRTSPVLRGKWVMEVLMGSPPPPPPPDVPDLDAIEEHKEGKMLTTRERMEHTRANPSCRSCHVFIDPIAWRWTTST